MENFDMDKCEFYNVEVIDGYFSGVAFIYESNKRYIVDISYDTEFEKLDIKKCLDVLYNSCMDKYDVAELDELKSRNYYLLKGEIQDFIRINGPLVFSTN